MKHRAELISLVQQIMRGDAVTEDDHDALVARLEEAVLDPNVLDYIYFPEGEVTAEQIVDRALAYRPVYSTVHDPSG